VPQREALDAAVRLVNEFDEFPSFLAAAIAHESSIGVKAQTGRNSLRSGRYLSVFMSVLPKGE
jgi:hypothetical protein